MKKLLLIFLCCGILFSGCGSDSDKKQVVNTVPKEEPKEETKPKEEVPDKKEEIRDETEIRGISPLSGQWIDKEVESRRPVAVMINNAPKALPQSGLSQADIIYEALAEGGITRLEAVFQDFNAEKIGPVRSARDYFTYFALDNDAIYIHHGGSPTGYQAIRNRRIDNLDGMVDSAFWRDQERLKKAGMYEHSSYTSAENILENSQAKNYRLERQENFPAMFTFYPQDTDLSDGQTANHLMLDYSLYQVSVFNYNAETKLYEKSQNGTAHIDELTGEILTTKNIIVQFAVCNIIPGDDAGRIDIDLVGKGKGLYLTNGKWVDITWEKEKFDVPTKWYDTKGNALKLNKGNTWICVFPLGKNYTISQEIPQ